MNILYVTHIWPGIRDVVFNGAEHTTGMPAFSRVLKRLIDEGHHVDIVLCSFYHEDHCAKLNIKASWLCNNNIISFVPLRSVKGLKKLIWYGKGYLDLYRSVCSALRNKQYDFVYGHGLESDAARIAANKYNVPFGQRCYGDSFWSLKQEKGLFYTCLFQPFEVLTFKTKKKFIVITDDGSNVDKAQKLLGGEHPPYEVNHWLNGVDRMPSVSEKELQQFKDGKFLKYPCLLYVARITDWKRQDLAIDLVGILKRRGIIVYLYLAGQKDSKYFEQLMFKASELGIKDQIIYMGAILQDDICKMAKIATASLSLYDICNLGNVFHELLASGAVIISRNDGSLDRFTKNGENGFLVDDMEQAADIVEKLITDSDFSTRIRNNALSTSTKTMMTWDERIEKEIKLIEKHALKNDKGVHINEGCK